MKFLKLEKARTGELYYQERNKFMNRFFIDKNSIHGNHAAIMGDDVAHISRVLRLKNGDEIAVCDGEGMECIATIDCISKNSVDITLGEFVKSETESTHNVILYQCLPKSGKMETIIQKCVELGIRKIVPVVSSRCVVKVDKKDSKNKTERYNRIAYEAAKQSRRGNIPVVSDIINISECDFSDLNLTIIAYEEEKELTLKDLLRSNIDAQNIGIFIGPEGGLEKSEVDMLIHKGGKSITLGNRILRTETAGMATLAMVLYELEG